MKDASEKHRQRIGQTGNAFPGSSAPVGFDPTYRVASGGELRVGGVVESANEEKEAEMLLHGLEAELGYDFSMPEL